MEPKVSLLAEEEKIGERGPSDPWRLDSLDRCGNNIFSQSGFNIRGI